MLVVISVVVECWDPTDEKAGFLSTLEKTVHTRTCSMDRMVGPSRRASFLTNSFPCQDCLAWVRMWVSLMFRLEGTSKWSTVSSTTLDIWVPH